MIKNIFIVLSLFGTIYASSDDIQQSLNEEKLKTFFYTKYKKAAVYLKEIRFGDDGTYRGIDKFTVRFVLTDGLIVPDITLLKSGELYFYNWLDSNAKESRFAEQNYTEATRAYLASIDDRVFAFNINKGLKAKYIFIDPQSKICQEQIKEIYNNDYKKMGKFGFVFMPLLGQESIDKSAWLIENLNNIKGEAERFEFIYQNIVKDQSVKKPKDDKFIQKLKIDLLEYELLGIKSLPSDINI